MLQTPSTDVAFCLERARACAEKAQEARDGTAKADFLDLETRWLLLAQSYQCSERTDNVDNTVDQMSYDRHDARNAGTEIFKLVSKHCASFDLDQMNGLATAFKGALKIANLDGNDPRAIRLARCIIELAQRGERDPVRLQSGALVGSTGRAGPGPPAKRCARL